jgi:hypothetical protein
VNSLSKQSSPFRSCVHIFAPSGEVEKTCVIKETEEEKGDGREMEENQRNAKEMNKQLNNNVSTL